MNELIIQPKSPFKGFVDYFTRRTNTVFNYFNAEGEKNEEHWGDASVVLDYSITCTEYSCQWASPGYTDNTKSFIIFSFKCPIFLTHYTLRNRLNTRDPTPRSWKVECSIDKDYWHLIDTKTDDNNLNSAAANHTYKCDKSFMYAKYVKISLIKTNTQYFFFHLSRVEFFGKMDIGSCTLPFKVLKRNTCKKQYHNNNSFCFVLAFLLVT